MHTHTPYSKVFLHDVHSVVVTPNGHVQVLNSSTGSVIHSTASNVGLTDKEQKSGEDEVVAAVVDESFKHLVIATSNKYVRVWEVDGLSIVYERETPKKPTGVRFTRDGQTILLSDKFGDVHRYPLRDSQASEIREGASTSGNAEAKGAKKRLVDETLLLGHVSLLTTLLLSKDDKYIITADRDEHIRVSWYPEAYTIESYCLGHRKFVSALHISPWDPSLLISGGGDPEIRIWNWMEGKLLSEIPIADAVMPFVKVVRKKPRRGEDGSDGEGQEGASKGGARDRRRGRKKRKGKEEVERDEESGDESRAAENGKTDMQVDEPHEGLVPSDKTDTRTTTEQEPQSEPLPVLAIQKIATIESGPSKYLIFSAHGATALFYCKFPDITTPSSCAVQVRSVALEQPVLDFAPWPGRDEIWISVDANWWDNTSTRHGDAKFVRTVKVLDDELVLSDDSTRQFLADSLNSTNRIEASEDYLNRIDLYSALVVLPKNADAEHSAMNDEALLSEATARRLSGKELGRLKTKKAVLALQTGQSSKREQSDTLEDRTLKRQRSETEAEVV